MIILILIGSFSSSSTSSLLSFLSQKQHNNNNNGIMIGVEADTETVETNELCTDDGTCDNNDLPFKPLPVSITFCISVYQKNNIYIA